MVERFPRAFFALVSVFLLCCAGFPTASLSDRGTIVLHGGIVLEQPGQNAIVAWNGEREIIVLSTNLRASEKTSVLEILPLPSKPSSVEKCDFRVFQELSSLYDQKLLSKLRERMKREKAGALPPPVGGEIVLRTKIGAHDISVAKVLNEEHFSSWVEAYVKGLVKNPSLKLSPEFKRVVQEYVDRGFGYFVVDVVEVSEDEKSVEPILYEFPSRELFYPMKITAVSDVGNSKGSVRLFLILPGEIDVDSLGRFRLYSPLSRSFGYPGSSGIVKFEGQELRRVHEKLFEMFPDGAYVVFVSSPYTSLRTLNEDLVLKKEDVKGLTAALPHPSLYQILIFLENFRALFSKLFYYLFLSPRALQLPTMLQGHAPQPQTQDSQKFCGISTQGPCYSDSDCVIDGCSLQVCRSRFEESVATTCEWRECYDWKRLGYACKCIDGRCMWSKE